MSRVVTAILLALLGSSLLLQTHPLAAKRFSEESVVIQPLIPVPPSSDPVVIPTAPPATDPTVLNRPPPTFSPDTRVTTATESPTAPTWLAAVGTFFTGGMVGAWVFGQPATSWQLGDSVISALVLLLLGSGVWFGWLLIIKRRRAVTAPPRRASRVAVDPTVDDELDYDVPLWFDNATFVEGTKLLFIRLQEAWDRGDVRDIRNYTTPAGFTALQQQRAVLGTGTAPHFTDIITLTAELCSIQHQDDEILAWVRFHGLLQDQATQTTRPFAERWQVRHKSDSQLGEWWITAIDTDDSAPQLQR
ncbi:Tim44 domain-containing protein [Rhodoferax sp. 4810]|uniref:Tim44 domain-containing protein n=1 Tax=Thiospirillum jenense TaxID=1653858 RepID=A0A839HD05_9GAMM|nr:Tim44-like domain-containing protein [Thiospirillum jenense]MBB1074557.1 Tim44 domain-containing protein [Rhodoferax jenense]MBB1126531.1 Tim44 domain-containing protein [Thiospirillum jenense]